MPNRQLEVALQALCELAHSPCGDSLPLSVLAPRLGVSLSYLEALFMDLRAARLVESQRGPGGGYRLAIDPAELPLTEVARAIGLHTLAGQREPRPEPPASTVEHLATEQLWDALERHALKALAPTCLADLMPMPVAS